MRVLKWIVVVVVALVLLAGAVWGLSRAMGPTAVERQALAMIDAPPESPGRDGYAELYTVGHDVPEAERAAVLAEDVRRFSAVPAQGEGPGSTWTSALQDWPALGQSREDDPAWCSLREPGCLQRVRAAPQAYAGLIGRNAALLDRAAALAAWDHFQSPFPARLDSPLPAYQLLTRSLTRDAWRFANGEVEAALAGACAGVAQGRGLIAAGDSLIGSMVGAALVDGNATLLAEMLAELPRGHPLPPQCEAAFALPLPTAEAVCRAMLAEGRFATEGMRHQVGASVAAAAAERNLPVRGTRLLLDPERTAARGAPKFAWYCGDQARDQIAADRPLHDPTPPPSTWTLACASNIIGCILMDIAAPAYADYGQRLQDADARLRTLAALLLDAEAGTLGTPLFFARPRADGQEPDGTWTVPLPASRLQPAAPAP